jgi:pimeloyl-ACP methyl ester carboxylesterase
MRRALLAALALLLIAAGPADRPVKAVAPGRLPVEQGQLALYSSADLAQPHPAITRALVIFHGLLRNADAYYAEALKTVAKAGLSTETTLVVAPQFLARPDIAPHDLPPDVLVWGRDSWSDGKPALQPAPISSYTAIDALIARLEDRRLFPALRSIVLAGHSAGAQTVQRYAAVGAGGADVRYVVANPSSYVYFTPARPETVTSCPGWNDWKYGFAGHLVPYITGRAADYEARYVGRDVITLLGTADTDPNHRLLDNTCAGEAQGPSRYARGHAYFALLQAQAGPKLHQRLFDIPGVPHNEARMFQSACGLYALFGTKGCADAR